MRSHPKLFLCFSYFLLSLLALSLAACTPADAPAAAEIEVTRLVPQTVVVTQIVEKIITATPEPSTPTPTPPVMAIAPDGLHAWCLPVNTSSLVARINPDGNMPDVGVPYQIVDGIPEITTQVSSCTFAFTFSSPVTGPVELHFLDTKGFAFQKSPLTPLEDNPNMAYTTETHQYIIDPPFWQITYDLQVVNASGEVLWASPVSFRRGWVPAKCYYGEWPDPVTCRCPNLPESHPWNPWWGWFPPYPDGCPR